MRKEDAIRHFGSAAELARVLRISRQAISKWGDDVPEGRDYQLEVLTNGALKAQEPSDQREHRKAS